MKLVGIFFVLLFSLSLRAEISLQLVDTKDPKVWMGTNLSYLMSAVVNPPSGDARVSSAPATVFIPVEDSTKANKNYALVSHPDELIKNSSGWSGYVRFHFVANNTSGDDLYLMSAAQDSGSSYRVIRDLRVVNSNTQNTEMTADMQMSDLCSTGTSFCVSTATSSFEKQIVLYYSKTLPAHNDSVTASDSVQTLYFKLRFSTTIPDSTATLTEVRRGDERLELVYTSSNFTEKYRTIVFSYASATLQPAKDIYTATSTGEYVLDSVQTIGDSGSFFVGDLANYKTYNLAIGFVNRYQFATKLSASKTGTPEPIEVFLEKQGCYLLSAGFQREHYVIDYFKKIRDDIFLKNFFGKKFVHFYYQTAPHYTRYIYESPTLSFLVRTCAFVLYFLFNYVLIFLFSVVLLVVVYKKLKRSSLYGRP